MFHYLAEILREYPTLALFLTVGLGFYIGRLRIGNFSLGSVTAVLLTGIAIGQLDIPMSGPIKMFFFMMFLFSIGYKVGPDFFRSLRGQGARQALFALTLSLVIGVTTIGIALLWGYDKGEATGLFSGSQTCSALLGVGSEAIAKLGIAPALKKQELDLIPVCYSVTYIFGTLGTVIILGNFGPRLLGGMEYVRRQTAELEKRLNKAEESDPAMIRARRGVAYRAYELTDASFAGGMTVAQAERQLAARGAHVYIEVVCRNGQPVLLAPGDVLHRFDTVVVCGRTQDIVNVAESLGPEVADTPALDFRVQRIDVVVARRRFADKPFAALQKSKFMRGVVIRDAVRGGKPLALTAVTRFAKGDRVTVIGRPEAMQRAVDNIGHADRPSVSSDLMFVGLAIFVGGLFGALSIWVGSVPVSFGTSGGALVAGLVFGWMRSKRPTYGNIAPGALWIMNNLGLTVFIAVIGIESAPSFVSGLRQVGPMLFVAGAVATTIPLFVGLWLGRRVFKFNPAITLGCIAGTRTCTASLGAVQTAIGSSLPAIGYTVTYAVSNLLLVIWGLVTVMVV